MPSVVLATAGYDQTIRFWEASTGVCYRSWKFAEQKQINCLRVTPNKKFIAAASNPTIRLFDNNSKSSEPIITYEGHTSNVTCIGFQKDGKWMYSGSEDGTIKIWDLRAAGCQRDYESKAAVNSVFLHPNQGELISGDQLGNVRIWDLAANRFAKEMAPQGTTPIRSVSITADAKQMIAANNNGNCFVWNPQSSSADFEPIKSFNAHKTHVLKCQPSPDAKYLATASSDRTVRIWNMSDWSLKTTLVGHQRWVWDCCFSADSMYLVTASTDNTARLWDVSSGEVVRLYAGHHTRGIVTVALNDSSVAT